MTEKNKKKFVLDCCNVLSSRLKPYQSEKDIFLSHYFLIKHVRNAKSQKKIPDFKNKKGITSLPPINNTASHTVRPNPGLFSRQSLKPLSREDLRAVIEKYRRDVL